MRKTMMDKYINRAIVELLDLTAIRLHIEICEECKRKYMEMLNHVKEPIVKRM